MNETIPILSMFVVAVIIMIIICAIALCLFLLYVCFNWIFETNNIKIHSYESYVI